MYFGLNILTNSVLSFWHFLRITNKCNELGALATIIKGHQMITRYEIKCVKL